MCPLLIEPCGVWQCDKHEVNKKMNIEMEELFAPWVIEKT